MAKVKSRGNESTELATRRILIREKIWGWRAHPKGILGNPDFIFPKNKIVIFVDGCFWHGCQICKRRLPRTRRVFWEKKIRDNRLRDSRQRKRLRSMDFRVMRIWEHEIKEGNWPDKLKRLLNKTYKE